MPAPVTTDLVWEEIEKRLFAVLSYVAPKAQARSAGIVSVVRDRTLHVGTGKESCKAKHIRLNPNVALNVTIRTYGVGVPLLDMRDPEEVHGRTPVS